MPQARKHEEIGRLERDAEELILRRDDGGRWRLDCGIIVRWRTRTLIGRRVRIIGERDGFDVLAVSRIEPAT